MSEFESTARNATPFAPDDDAFAVIKASDVMAGKN
jgi:molybdopterin-binding protein